jgi:hypothetical protein
MMMTKRMGHLRQWVEDMQARLPKGAFKRIAEVTRTASILFA